MTHLLLSILFRKRVQDPTICVPIGAIKQQREEAGDLKCPEETVRNHRARASPTAEGRQRGRRTGPESFWYKCLYDVGSLVPGTSVTSLRFICASATNGGIVMERNKYELSVHAVRAEVAADNVVGRRVGVAAGLRMRRKEG
jgi:hypothetical protein